jgi:LysR family hydrogen peroxide-inducible transcriptional activator
MNIRDLKYLVALMDQQHFGKAAEACFVSQPALSMQIKKLEEHLGVQLLERTNKSVMFTDVGLVISERARQILSYVDEMKEIARQSSDPYGGELRLGIFPTLAPYILPHISPILAKKFARISLFLLEEQTTPLLEKVMQGKIDAAILAMPIHEKGLTIVPLFEEEFLLVVSSKHPYAKRKFIQQEDLADQPLLLLEEGHCLREQALSLCLRVQAHENQNFRATSLETLRHMVASGVGMTLMPKLACQPNKSLVYIPFKKPRPMRSICMVWRTTTAKKTLLEEMSKEIGNIMK